MRGMTLAGRLASLGFADADGAERMITGGLATGIRGEDDELLRTLAEAADPDVALAGLSRLAAGLKGIENDYELPPGAEDDVWALSPAERRALGIGPLPQSLAEACDVMEGSELVAETLGEVVFDYFLRNKRAEWREYRRQVTEFELDRYLPVL